METQGQKKIAILGSTGSIGTQTLDIISDNPEKFRAYALTAKNNWQLLVAQAKRFKPEVVVIANDAHYTKVKDSLNNLSIEVFSGAEAISEIVTLPDVDMVVTAMVGYSGLIPTINAIKSNKTIALANKETLVVAGELITKLTQHYKTKILPVDSEHSAIFQCLTGENKSSVKKIILTASGGPFRNLNKDELKYVTVKDALHHPNWDMGAKVTIDSASMMNKGFEMIEARWLFDCAPENIEILVHPQSIVHSMVEFHDGSIKAQLGIPDMHIPIQYALSHPERIATHKYQLNWADTTKLTFEKPDYDKFPLLRMAFEAIKTGGNMPCILNAANEVAVKAFLNGKIKFTQMSELIEFTMQKSDFIHNPDLDNLISTNSGSVKIAQQWVEANMKTHC